MFELSNLKTKVYMRSRAFEKAFPMMCLDWCFGTNQNPSTLFFAYRHHKEAVRSVCFHPQLPLFASASDDSYVLVCHGQVFK